MLIRKLALILNTFLVLLIVVTRSGVGGSGFSIFEIPYFTKEFAQNTKAKRDISGFCIFAQFFPLFRDFPSQG